MSARRLGTVRWLGAFTLLTLAALATLVWSLIEERRSAPVGAEVPRPGIAAAPAEHGPEPLIARLSVDTGGAALTLVAAGVEVPSVEVVQGGARLEGSSQPGAQVHVLPTGEPGPWTLALARGEPWSVHVGAGAAQVRLDLADLPLRELRVGAPTGGVEGTLPRTGRTELALGPGRSSLWLKRNTTVDARVTLGSGALVLRVDPGAHGRLELAADAGPTTVIVDAGVSVALELPSGEPPPLALEGTWWRYRRDGHVTWVRAPVATAPEQVELTVALLGPAHAPLAVTYR